MDELCGYCCSTFNQDLVEVGIAKAGRRGMCRMQAGDGWSDAVSQSKLTVTTNRLLSALIDAHCSLQTDLIRF